MTFQHRSATSPAVSDITFGARRGETIAFVGPSGAGKTTLVKLLVGLYPPGSGRILYNGISSDEIDLDVLRERIGFVTQDTQLFSGTIRENLLFVNPRATDAECLDVLHRAACDSLLARASKGLDTVIGEGGVKVSGGEKQRLSIARALLRRPQLLVFDEATSSLDSLTEEGIVETIRDVAKTGESITILIAHRLSTILHADRIYVLERGRIVETGRHDQLVAQKGLYFAMWRQQIGERRSIPRRLRGLRAEGSGPDFSRSLSSDHARTDFVELRVCRTPITHERDDRTDRSGTARSHGIGRSRGAGHHLSPAPRHGLSVQPADARLQRGCRGCHAGRVRRADEERRSIQSGGGVAVDLSVWHRATPGAAALQTEPRAGSK